MVLGFRSRHLDVEIPNTFIADSVSQYSDRTVGFAGIDPMDGAKALEDIHRAKEGLKLKGIVIAPACQAMHPAHSQALAVYELAERLGLPVVIHNSPPLPAGAHLEFARPFLLDEVLRSFPNLRVLITHVGYPWVDETFVLLGKHENAFAEISGIVQSPWMALQYMQAAQDFGVMDKLCFGSDFPFSTPKSVIESLYSLNQIVHGTTLPSVPREQLRSIVERESLALLGIDFAVKAPAADAAGDETAGLRAARHDSAISPKPEQAV